MTTSILIVDDEKRLAEVLALALEARDYRATFVYSVAEALAHLKKTSVDLVLSDLRMPELGGRELLTELRTLRPEIPVIIMTAYASVRDAVEMVKEGAFDYVAKPFEIDDVIATIERALQLQTSERENRRLRKELGEKYDFRNLIGTSAEFREVLRQISEVCKSKATVLLQGESGTGKELVARAIHYNSPRAKAPFVAVNCAAIPEALLESELFGHVKGAFTGAIATRDGRFSLANGGTLLLDEIGDMPLPLQAKVLRVLQEQTFEPVGGTKSVSVDVRIIAATHKNLKDEAVKGLFREDLFYRLNVFPMTAPALRNRIDDIPILAEHFLARYCADMAKKISGFSPAAISAMASYGWPGNIRELQNCIERAVIVAGGSSIDVADLPPYIFDASPQAVSTNYPMDLDAELARIERELITAALRESGNIQIRAAERLGISERSFWHRIKKLGIKIVKTVD
ncbi:MAG: sigma-54-dependent Fis family transcriptional regulator [Hyphomicrobiales bacterium]|nr:sigma-54-dependent Fis family transcriptional regulator [Hyphomicrobiales bacterium]